MRTLFKALAASAIVLLGTSAFAQTGGTGTKLSGIVTRSGSRLMLNGKPFRFAGANLDNVNLASSRYSLIVSITGKIDAKDDMMGKNRLGFEATTKVNRMDYGIAWNKKNKTGTSMLADEVEITIAGEAVE